MTFKAFLIGLLGTFGLPWLLVVVIPFATMQNVAPVEYEDDAPVSGVYAPKREGRITEGSKIYGQEGCYYCHTQVIRPTYAGNDVHRDEWAGLRKGKGVANDTRRETLALDYEQEAVAHIGVSRVGPDLSNFGRRVSHYLKGSGISSEEWILQHLYNPQGVARYDSPDEKVYDSTCPTKAGMFDKVEVYGAGSRSLSVEGIEEGMAIVPSDRARALASYLLSLKKDTYGNPLPRALNYNPEAPLTEK